MHLDDRLSIKVADLILEICRLKTLSHMCCQVPCIVFEFSFDWSVNSVAEYFAHRYGSDLDTSVGQACESLTRHGHQWLIYLYASQIASNELMLHLLLLFRVCLSKNGIRVDEIWAKLCSAIQCSLQLFTTLNCMLIE